MQKLKLKLKLKIKNDIIWQYLCEEDFRQFKDFVRLMRLWLLAGCLWSLPIPFQLPFYTSVCPVMSTAQLSAVAFYPIYIKTNCYPSIIAHASMHGCGGLVFIPPVIGTMYGVRSRWDMGTAMGQVEPRKLLLCSSSSNYCTTVLPIKSLIKPNWLETFKQNIHQQKFTLVKTTHSDISSYCRGMWWNGILQSIKSDQLVLSLVLVGRRPVVHLSGNGAYL